MSKKTFWRCTVCGDMHYGAAAPENCPTCGSPRSKAKQIEKKEFLKILED